MPPGSILLGSMPLGLKSVNLPIRSINFLETLPPIFFYVHLSLD